MIIPPEYVLNADISSLLSKIEANKEVINSIQVPPEIEQNIRRKSILKSSLFSARIEGNTVLMNDFPNLSEKDQKKIEINNILRAINWVYERSANKQITEKEILSLHSIVLKGIAGQEAGKYRTKHEGIFSAAGVVVYHAPPPNLIKGYVKKLLNYINNEEEKFVPVKACLAHYIFEKIHPFADGSGRVGRLLMLLVLKNGGYGFKGILPFEEKINEKRENYYKMLEESGTDVSLYLEFMLETVAEASEEAKNNILAKNTYDPVDTLLPRRAEIYRIIKDHKLINLDTIKRRFSNVNARTLRYDLKKLCDAGFVQKAGTTKGVYYKIRKTNG